MLLLEKASDLVSDPYVSRSKKDKLQEIFEKYASIEENGHKYMTPEDFVVKFLGLYEPGSSNTEVIHLLASAVDYKKTGRISFEDFEKFEGVLAYPDCLHRTIFQLFDADGDGIVSFNEFKRIISKSDLTKKISYDFNSPVIQWYFGANKERSLNFPQFSKFLHDFYQSHTIQCFTNADKGGTGYISVSDFQNIMLNVKGHLLTPKVESFVRDVSRLPFDHVPPQRQRLFSFVLDPYARRNQKG
ncbi:HLH domain-containing protein [Oryctes borbonicus]|uniref:HLH domain-containing protein n=1 Tax=Oryctes borbonicus TaxID=1629725 RepID=A0A0T6BDI4_9SCAR|nr:HLH domain-containing protein [Oryctes borbonicus]